MTVFPDAENSMTALLASGFRGMFYTFFRNEPRDCKKLEHATFSGKRLSAPCARARRSSLGSSSLSRAGCSRRRRIESYGINTHHYKASKRTPTHNNKRHDERNEPRRRYRYATRSAAATRNARVTWSSSPHHQTPPSARRRAYRRASARPAGRTTARTARRVSR